MLKSRNYNGMQTMVYLGIFAPGDKVSFGATVQSVRGSIDAKSELGAKEGRKLTWALKFLVNVTDNLNHLNNKLQDKNEWFPNLVNHISAFKIMLISH